MFVSRRGVDRVRARPWPASGRRWRGESPGGDVITGGTLCTFRILIGICVRRRDRAASGAAARRRAADRAGRRPRPTPLRVDAQRNLEHVLRAAREVFGELGYGAPMEDVARRARVGVGTVYRRFPSKDVLVRRIAEEETSRLTEQARAALGPGGGAVVGAVPLPADVGGLGRRAAAAAAGAAGRARTAEEPTVGGTRTRRGCRSSGSRRGSRSCGLRSWAAAGAGGRADGRRGRGGAAGGRGPAGGPGAGGG